MDNNLESKFIGEYASALRTSSGCVQSFCSQTLDKLAFPPSTNTFCELCNVIHAFHLVRTHTLITKSQEKNFDSWCNASGISRRTITLK